MNRQSKCVRMRSCRSMLLALSILLPGVLAITPAPAAAASNLNQPPNQPPAANNDSYSVAQDSQLVVPAPGVLENDSDPEGQALAAELVSPPTNGQIVDGGADGSFTYQPNPGFTGLDSFTYRAVDTAGAPSSPATVSISVGTPTPSPTATAVPTPTPTPTPPATNTTTRGQGFWATQFAFSSATWLAIPAAERDFCAGLKPMGDGIEDVEELFGGFWAGISKDTLNNKRSAEDQARMQLIKQLLAAMLNFQAFGSAEGETQALIGAAKAVYCHPAATTADLLAQKDRLEAHNVSGEAFPFPPGVEPGTADPNAAREAAREEFWDSLP